jgi:hypothetical protein
VVEVVALLAGNLETDETEAFFRDNGLLTFVTDDDRFEFHSSPPQLSWLSLIRKAGFRDVTRSLPAFAGAMASGQPRTRNAPAQVRFRVRNPNGW